MVQLASSIATNFRIKLSLPAPAIYARTHESMIAQKYFTACDGIHNIGGQPVIDYTSAHGAG